MFAICESMKWTHLPNAGGLYDQDPDLLDGFQIIFHERSEYESKKNAEEERKQNRGMGRGRSATPSRRARRK